MRKIYRQLIFFLLLVVISFGASANSCGWFLDNLTSPVCTDAKYIFWTGTLVTASLAVVKNSFVEELAKDTVAKDHLKNYGNVGEKIGDGYLNGAYFLGQLLFGGRKGNMRAEHMFEASFYSFGITYGLKSAISESRPGYPDMYESFPSGHSSFSFAFASVVSSQHGAGWGSLAYLMAMFIAFSRMDENWHYLHDVTAGITIGMSYGWGIYWNHSAHQKPYWLSLLPSADMSGANLAFVYNF